MKEKFESHVIEPEILGAAPKGVANGALVLDKTALITQAVSSAVELVTAGVEAHKDITIAKQKEATEQLRIREQARIVREGMDHFYNTQRHVMDSITQLGESAIRNGQSDASLKAIEALRDIAMNPFRPADLADQTKRS